MCVEMYVYVWYGVCVYVCMWCRDVDLLRSTYGNLCLSGYQQSNTKFNNVRIPNNSQQQCHDLVKTARLAASLKM